MIDRIDFETKIESITALRDGFSGIAIDKCSPIAWDIGEAYNSERRVNVDYSNELG